MSLSMPMFEGEPLWLWIVVFLVFFAAGALIASLVK